MFRRSDCIGSCDEQCLIYGYNRVTHNHLTISCNELTKKSHECVGMALSYEDLLRHRLNFVTREHYVGMLDPLFACMKTVTEDALLKFRSFLALLAPEQ